MSAFLLALTSVLIFDITGEFLNWAAVSLTDAGRGPVAELRLTEMNQKSSRMNNLVTVEREFFVSD